VFLTLFYKNTQELRTYLREAAGSGSLGVRKDVVCSHLSTKLNRVVSDIEKISGKIVVFSQYQDAVDTLMTVLEQRGIKAVSLKARMKPSLLSQVCFF